jgi:hypothetical protein
VTQKLLPLINKGFVFACTNSSQDECFERMLFGSRKVNGAVAMRVKKEDFVSPFNFNSGFLNEIIIQRKGTLNAKQ